MHRNHPALRAPLRRGELFYFFMKIQAINSPPTIGKSIVTWNFSHFVGAEPKYRVFAALRDWGYEPALLVTPEELMENTDDTI